MLNGPSAAWRQPNLPCASLRCRVEEALAVGRYFNGKEARWGKFHQTVWYAPNVNRAVKEEYLHEALNGSTWYQEKKELMGCN